MSSPRSEQRGAQLCGKTMHMLPPFLTCSWCPPVKGWKQRALSVISRSSPLSEFTVCIVRRGFAYWGISGRTGALTTGTTIDWHDAKIVDPVGLHAMHNSIVILSIESLLWPSSLSTRRLVLRCHYTPYVAPILHQTGADGELLDL